MSAAARLAVFLLLCSFSISVSTAYSDDGVPEGGNSTPPAIAEPDATILDEPTRVDASYSIGTITIIPNPVFDLSNPNENTFIGRTGNQIHVVTKESTIRNDLLFKEGDAYDKEIIEETERNLRLHPYLTDVQIITKPNKETKTVDVSVMTKDQWTLIVGGSIGGTSEDSVYGLDIGEKNLAGLGQTLSYSFRYDNSGSTHSAAFSDPNLMGSRYALGLSYLQTPLEVDRGISFQQPFYSLETESAHGFSYATIDHFEPTLNYNKFRLVAFYGLAYDLSGVLVRPSVIASLGEQTIYSLPNPSYTTRDNKLELQVSLLAEPRNFAKDTYIQKYRQVEDIPLGAQYVYLLGQGMVAIGSTTTEISMIFQALKWTKLQDRDYVYAGLTLSENDDNFNKQLADFQVQYYYRNFLQHTLFFNFQASYMDSDSNRFYLGGTTGLRGYRVNEFMGRNRLLINVEDRIYTYRSILMGILEPGFVLFLDAGDAWNNFSGDPFHGLHASFGAGLRLAILKSPGISLVQVDYGFPFNLNGAPVLTVGMSGTF